MQAVIYAGLRNGARDQKIFDALTYKHVVEVAKEFQLAPSTIRSAARRIAEAELYDLKLLGGQPNANWESRRQVVPACRPGRVPELPRHLPEP